MLEEPMSAPAISDNLQDRGAATFAAPEPVTYGSRGNNLFSMNFYIPQQ